MADPQGPDRAGKSGPGSHGSPDRPDEDLAQRGRELDAAIRARRPAPPQDEDGRPSGTMAGIGQALRLSSEFIAGVLVGAAFGWFVDWLAGTSPWGLIVFLLLGFAAGVLNALRSAGLVAEVDPKAGQAPSGRSDRKD